MRIYPIHSEVIPQGLPSVRVPLNIDTGFAQGLGQLGAAAGQIADVFSEIEKRKKNFEDSVALTDLTGQAKIALAGHYQELQVSDYPQIDETQKKGLERISKDMSDRAIKVNPEVAAQWTKIWSTLSSESIIDAGKIKTEKFRQYTIAGTVNFMHLMEGEAVKAAIEGDAEQLALVNKLVNAKVDNVRKEFRIGGHQAEAWKQSFEASVKAKVEAAVKEYQRQQEKQRITIAYQGITEEARDPVTGTTNYAKAYELLKEPETLNRYGITVEQKKELGLIFTNEQARDKEETEKAREQQRAAIQPRVFNGTATRREIDATTLDAKEKLFWKEKLEVRNKAIIAGNKNPLEVTDPGTKADLSKMALVNPEDMKSMGGNSYIWSFVGKGLSITDAEHITKLYEQKDKPGKGPLQTSAFTNAVKTLDLLRKNLVFIDKTLDDDITDQEQFDNQRLYGSAYQELENRVKAGEKPSDVLEDVMKPYLSRVSASLLDRFIDWVKGVPTGQGLEETAFNLGTELVKPKKLKTPETEPIAPSKDMRSRAIEILKRNRKLVNEETIKAVMDQL